MDGHEEQGRQAATAETGGTETILVVEDEDGLRKLVYKILSRQGYTVIETRNGQEALEESARHAGPIALLLTDVVLPKMSGHELAESLKSQRPQMKVLYMSGYGNDAVQSPGVTGPKPAFLQKPFAPSTLFEKVREVLTGKDS